jgi:hypothetical protein
MPSFEIARARDLSYDTAEERADDGKQQDEEYADERSLTRAFRSGHTEIVPGTVNVRKGAALTPIQWRYPTGHAPSEATDLVPCSRIQPGLAQLVHRMPGVVCCKRLGSTTSARAHPCMRIHEIR